MWAALLLVAAAALPSGAQDVHMWEHKTLQIQRAHELHEAGYRPRPPKLTQLEDVTSSVCSAAGLDADCDVDAPTIRAALNAISANATPTLPPFQLTGSCEVDVTFFYNSLLKLKGLYADMAKCNASASCVKELTDAQAQYAWVLRQFDSFGKMESGVMEGNVYFLGSWQECTGIVVPRTGKSDYETTMYVAAGPVSSLYAKLVPDLGASLDEESLGADATACAALTPYTAMASTFCLPQSCSDTEASALVMLLSGGKSSPFCGAQRKPKSYAMSEGAIIVTVILSVFVVLSLLSGMLDYFYYTPLVKARKESLAAPVDDGWFIRFVIAFSLYNNAQRILETTKRPGQIDCLHGIRFLSMSWVIMGHSYSIMLGFLDNGYSVLQTLPKKIMNIIILNATFSVDSFFLMSGMLASFLWLKTMRKSKGKLITNPYTWFMYYVHRYLRLTPMYALIVAMAVFLSPYITRGPQRWAPETAPGYETCKVSWWTNLLYINNLVYAKSAEQCYGVTWYLANDMQFHVFAPILLLLFFYLPVIGVSLGGLLIVVSMSAEAFTTSHFFLPAITTFGAWVDPRSANASATVHLTSGEVNWVFRYAAPWIRLQPYVLGLILGWALQTYPRLRIPKALNALGWLLAAGTALAVVFGGYDTVSGVELDLWVRTLYAGVSRCLWSICLGWVIFSCHYGKGGWINEFLAWPGWIPLSRLTYCTYLLHYTIATDLAVSTDSRMHWNGHYVHILTFYLPMLVVTLGLAFLLSAIVEVPISNIEMLIFNPRKMTAVAPAPATALESEKKPSPSPESSVVTGSAADLVPLEPLRLRRVDSDRAAVASERSWELPLPAKPNEY